MAEAAPGFLPLLWTAAAEGKMEDVRQLLSDGADIQEPGLEQTSSLHIAVWWIGNEGLVRLLLENGADASAKDKQGATPLHYAAIKGREEIALLLLSHGAEVSAKDNAGSTPLQFATNQEMAQLLLEHGAVPVKDTEGETRCRAAA